MSWAAKEDVVMAMGRVAGSEAVAACSIMQRRTRSAGDLARVDAGPGVSTDWLDPFACGTIAAHRIPGGHRR
jgi:hypothetical protein